MKRSRGKYDGGGGGAKNVGKYGKIRGENRIKWNMREG